MARSPAQAVLNPTLFDKLVAGNEIGGLRGEELENAEERRDSLRFLSVPTIERFNEAALRATVRRELAWLLNTTNFESSVDLEAFPQVRTSVLNYGVPDLAGRSLNSRAVLRRAREIRDAVKSFEPRIDPLTLHVELSNKVERENALTFVIEADVRSAVRAVPIKLRTDVEADSSAVTVRE
ncbi:MAG: type VI secretion protein [Novosphingobium sp. 28-62-57]|uniref:type VI secretion system baseplate subunit TssE n=1 Tax=unclassified Novosphingobium TaxID=2644732 RepID=UPI000BDC7867|nr:MULTISPECIES: type VI secretion system baseplate subunit TssE [unclassified Novosphingobium]OYW47874.1 MAG: type VI secretion protein [Novosphingobium sp. 12-63-9]OYZ10767.1 MAG: type VI secretion protein [Novosphingobium sp. 28-62-57]OZA37882.1 MAG: type VI secretion protein [Novosphingobium sp. 17-62-9]HQS68967.1 type VI secretion system baseplate subunit TssE [Novosphingobium sp.]